MSLLLQDAVTLSLSLSLSLSLLFRGYRLHAAVARVPAAGRTGADDAEPADGLAGREAVRLHEPQRDERPGPPQARLAVHRHQAPRPGPLAHQEEAQHLRARRRTVVLFICLLS